jgi:uncharacterized protein (TIGR03086 family)
MISIKQRQDGALSTAVELDRRAVRASVDLVSGIQRSDLGRATPCAGWSLADLLAHLTAQHRGFAAAATGHGEDPAAWALPAATEEPVAAYRAAAATLLEAFDGLRDGDSLALPELTADGPFDALTAVRFHLVDYAVHGWDLARSLDTTPRLDEDVLDAALAIALAVPDDPARRGPGGPFRPAVPLPDGTSTLDRMVAALGRSPRWEPPSGQADSPVS